MAEWEKAADLQVQPNSTNARQSWIE